MVRFGEGKSSLSEFAVEKGETAKVLLSGFFSLWLRGGVLRDEEDVICRPDAAALVRRRSRRARGISGPENGRDKAGDGRFPGPATTRVSARQWWPREEEDEDEDGGCNQYSAGVRVGAEPAILKGCLKKASEVPLEVAQASLNASFN
ncbi:hypothetical protein Ddye_025257 [Dipteronia dyeriana]|uniref:Uncharacterized protein n=1 Tax=Dipteronia dyeriana TaxID=168575 RepID=A0AAD9TWD9_9ROSI|nr:hypothetical protein Ddye_025257 [Dipteronia dyeriana]